jgi:PAS domain S-box-containing protein
MNTKNYRNSGKASVLLNLLSDPAAIVDEKGNFLTVNDMFEEATGLSWKELIGNSFFKLDITSENKAVLLENLRKRLQGTPVEPYEVCFTGKLGEKRCVEVKGRNVSYAGQYASLVVFHDVTLRKENARRLKEYSEQMEKLVEEKVKEIRDQEEKYRNLFESAPDVIVTIDLTGKITSVNKAIMQYGFKEKEIVGNSIFKLVPIEYNQKMFTGLNNIAAGNSAQGEIEILTPNGKRTAEYNSTPLRLNGKVVGYQTIIRDVTERKNAEEALKESEKKSRAIVANAPIGIATSGADKHFLSANEAFCRILGYTEDELRKLTFKDITHLEDLKESAIKMGELENGRISSFTLEKRYIKKDGTMIDGKVTVNAVRNQNGKPSLFVAELEDITDARRVQDALMESESQYRQLVNVAQEGIWALDSSYRIVFVNPRMAEMLGYAESEMIGKNLAELLNKRCIEQVTQFLWQFQQSAKGHFDCEIGRKDGSCIYVSIAVSVISNDEGKPSGTLMMVSDITDRKVLERKVDNYSKHLKSMVELRTAQLKDANERLVKSERLAAIGELAGMVGHDLRNPLTGIKNATYYLKKKGATCPESQAKEMLETIDKCIDHANKIINDLLDYSREIHLDLTEYAPRSLFDDALRMIQVPDRIQIVNHVLGETQIRVDTDKMMRVFINLIKNAIDAMPEKGTLKIRSRQTKDTLEIAFADTGIGIPEETLRKLFLPLSTTKAQGMGFGLAICKRIIEAHGGTITVKTEVGKGTTFTVTLPVKPKVEVGGEKTWINMPESLLSTTTKA